MTIVSQIFAEPPFRQLAKLAVRFGVSDPRVRDFWGAADRPHYLAGVLFAADQAKREGLDRVAVVEFGVAAGDGLLVLERHAKDVEQATGVEIVVVGFDTGGGLPESTGDYRDHPDVWQPGDYRMDVQGLTARLGKRTTLILGDIRDTALTCSIPAPIGFVSIDVDYYSSTVNALKLLQRDSQARLHRVAIYCDDTLADYNHRFAGELLAIDEFNASSAHVKIDQWRGLRGSRPFRDSSWYDAMFIAHDLKAISAVRLTRGAASMK